ncbi:MAG: tetratricopeptide repeat protein [Lentisphaeria bacterium]
MFASDVELYTSLLKSCAPFAGNVAENFSVDDYKIVQNWPEELQRQLITYNKQRNLQLGGSSTKYITTAQIEKVAASLGEDDRKIFNLMLPSDKLLMAKSRIDSENQLKSPPVKSVDRKENTQVTDDCVEKIPADELAMLRKCYADFRNVETTRSERIATAEAYLKKYPNSPIRASIYYNMGMCYTQRSRNEEWDREKADIYYRKAHEAWGEKYSGDHMMVWASLCNRPYGNVDERIAYLAYLYKIVNANSIEVLARERFLESAIATESYYYLKNDLVLQFKDFHSNVEDCIDTATSNIIFRSQKSPEDLRKIIAAFPGKPIATEAQKILGIEVDEIVESPVIVEEVTEIVIDNKKDDLFNGYLLFLFATILVAVLSVVIFIFLRKRK